MRTHRTLVNSTTGEEHIRRAAIRGAARVQQGVKQHSQAAVQAKIVDGKCHGVAAISAALEGANQDCNASSNQ
jgi:hypothetical protein